MDKWSVYAAMGINFACELHCDGDKSYLPHSKLFHYPMATLHEPCPFDETGSDFPAVLDVIANVSNSLRDIISSDWDRSDMITVRCLGEDETIYTKNFRIATEENVDREMKAELMQEFDRLRRELNAEKLHTIRSNRFLAQLQHELAEVNGTCQALEIELQHRMALRNGTAPPTVKLPTLGIEEMEMLSWSTDPIPSLFRRLITEDLAHFSALDDWDALDEQHISALPILDLASA